MTKRVVYTTFHLLSMAYIYLYKILAHGCTFIWYTTYLSSDAYSHLVPYAHSLSILISSHTYTLIEKSAGVTLYVHTYLYILPSSQLFSFSTVILLYSSV